VLPKTTISIKAEGTHNMDNKTQDKGFTLVELLIVIVILGILATVTVFAVRGITDSGQESACNADEKTLQVAVGVLRPERRHRTSGGSASWSRPRPGCKCLGHARERGLPRRRLAELHRFDRRCVDGNRRLRLIH